MHRLIFLLFLSAFIGCGTATKPQEFGTPIDDSSGAPALKIAGDKPETTDATTRESFDKIVLAHTNNQPSRIEQLRKHKQHRKGERIVGDFRSPLEMDVVASWPTLYRANYLHTIPAKIVHSFSFRNDAGWQHRSDQGCWRPDRQPPRRQACRSLNEWSSVLAPPWGVVAMTAALLPSLRASGFRWRLRLDLRGMG